MASIKTSGVEHGPEVVCYSGGPQLTKGDPYYKPSIQCLCGWAAREDSWRDVGAMFDEHIEATRATTETK